MIYEPRTLKLLANVPQEIAGPMESLALVSASVDVADVAVQFNGSGEYQPLILGMSLGNLLELKVEKACIRSSVPQVVVISAGQCTIADDRSAATGASLGSKTDAAASSDDGSFSILAFIKRICGKITDAITAVGLVQAAAADTTAAVALVEAAAGGTTAAVVQVESAVDDVTAAVGLVETAVGTTTTAVGQVEAAVADVETAVLGVVKIGGITDRSGTITAGGTEQQLMAGNVNRRYLLVQNVSDGDLWINIDAAANPDQPSIRLTPDASFSMEGSFVTNAEVRIYGATAGQAFTAKEL